MTKEEIIAIVQECAARLGHAPNRDELEEMGKVPRRVVRKSFGSHLKMLAASGIQGEGPGYPISMRSLFLEWAQVARKLGKIPTVIEYQQSGKYSIRPLFDRFGNWRDLPAGMGRYARKEGLDEEWKDVLEIIGLHEEKAAKLARIYKTTTTAMGSSPCGPRVLAGQPMYGRPLPHFRLAVSYAPTNEAGVVLVFGSMARSLGFIILRVQTEFPDCEAMREVQPNRWQKVRIEFEYESRSFLDHMHPAAECDLIVCWKHTWPDCPLDVLELESLAEAAGADSGFCGVDLEG